MLFHAGKFAGLHFFAVLRERHVSASSIQLCWRAAACAESFRCKKGGQKEKTKNQEFGLIQGSYTLQL